MKTKLLLSLCIATLATGCLQMESARLVGGPDFDVKVDALVAHTACNENINKLSKEKDLSIVKVRLKNEVVDKVLQDLKGKSDTINFWNNLSQQTSQELLLNLGISLGPELIAQTRVPLKAVAFVFEELLRTGIKDSAYQIKTKEGITYSFEITGEALESVSSLAQKCDDKILDVSKVILPKTAQKLSEITETYRCKVKTVNVDLIRMEKSSFLITKTENIEVQNTDIKIKESKRKMVLSIDTKEVQLTLKFKKKVDRKLDDIDGNKTKIDLRTAGTDVDGKGVCEFMTEN